VTKDELIPILEKHEKWLINEDGGERANLSDADLRGANLSWANLREANLSEADLRGANLSWANLRGADLREADLREANLRGANLSWANLRGADLREADLREADLSEANTMDLITAGPIGSRHGITIYNIAADEIRCGCFSGNLTQFSERVEREHANNQVFLAEYRAAIAFFEAVKVARVAESAETELQAQEVT